MPHLEAVIGLEVHVQLATSSKLFCACPTNFGSQPNTNICTVCAGLPGALPRLNQKAIEYAVKAGLALNCTINNGSLFDRKNYFYPDLPTGYQISQNTKALCNSGYLDILSCDKKKRIQIHQIHLECDAGKAIHTNRKNTSCIDLNRAGIPLIEIISAPDMRTAEEAVSYLKALHAIVTYLGITDGNMEEGSFRCDANVSIKATHSKTLGTRTEIKNINSFRNVQRAIEYEILRQRDLINDKKEVQQETRLYDTTKNVTIPIRTKETAHDYRYFPDPDLLPIYIEQEQLSQWKTAIPELPEQRKKRFIEELQLSQHDTEILIADKNLADFFENAVQFYPKPLQIARIIIDNIIRMLNQYSMPLHETSIQPIATAELARIIDEGLISHKIAHDIFGELFTTGAMPEAYVRDKGLIQISDTTAIELAVTEVIAENPAEVTAYINGKTKLLSFFVGQVMKKTRGKANPEIVHQILSQKLMPS